MNNNKLKSDLLYFISTENINLVAYEELDIKNLQTSDIELILRSNERVLHTIVIDYHLRIKGIKTNINGSNLTELTFYPVSRIIDFCNSRGSHGHN